MGFTTAASAALVAAAAALVAPAAADDFNSEKFVFSFSGGGARAALGSMQALEWMENVADFGRQVESVNGLSGGSWGSTLFFLKEYGTAMLDDVKDKTPNKKKGFLWWKHEVKGDWASLEHFDRGTAAAAKLSDSKRQKVYGQWHRDVQEHVFGESLEQPWASVGAKVAKGYSHKLCSFFSNGDKADPEETCKWCAGHKAECFKNTNNAAPKRRTLDLTKKATICTDLVRPQGLTTADVMTLTSSAWTFVGREIPVKLEGQGAGGNAVVNLRVSDAGIDCNVPFDPSWTEAPPQGERRTILMFDFSDDSGSKDGVEDSGPAGASLVKCIRKWNARHNLGLALHDVVSRSTRLNSDGTTATKGERSANKLKANLARKNNKGGSGGHEVNAHVKRLSVGQRKDVEIYWVQFRNLASSTEMMKAHPTVSFLGWPHSYSMAKINDIQTQYRKFLSDHVQSFLGKRLGKGGGMSVVGVANLYE